MSQPKRPKESKKNPLNSYAQYSAIAFQMMAIIGLGTYGGIKLDEAYPNDYHLYTLICSLVSIALAMYLVIKRVSDMSKNP